MCVSDRVMGDCELRYNPSYNLELLDLDEFQALENLNFMEVNPPEVEV